MKKKLILIAALCGAVAAGATDTKDVLPSARHLEWADCEIGVIIHEPDSVAGNFFHKHLGSPRGKVAQADSFGVQADFLAQFELVARIIIGMRRFTSNRWAVNLTSEIATQG